MIRDVLVSALLTHFPDRAFRTGEPPDPIIQFPAAHLEVGDLNIYDEGRGVIVEIGEITHGQFDGCDPGLSADERAQDVADDVVYFLEALFTGRVVLWKSRDGLSGGWRYLGSNTASMPFRTEGQEHLTYLWSGPLGNSDRDQST